ncbi:class I SAM-dependent methyltransferase [Actinoplanes sp. DH11]|uniref:class I SAM-dependent methyltransferase n=1 Tax=Actinoplanes sp. DH11 TaxID=2857011 RepID=UPI001E3687BE|nr:class I SAM-dependent methyltransferase [Actinoplanes sp. DH11]
MTDRVRAFDTASNDFDRLGHHLWQPIGAATVDRTAPSPGERVLDACCGTGASALPAAHRVGVTGRVDAIDLSAPMVRVLGQHAAGLPQLHPQVADATAWESGDYDVVQAVLGVFFFPDMAAGTEHLVRRARPGGRVGVTIWRKGAVELAGQHLGAAVGAVTGKEAPKRPSGPIDGVNTAETFRPWLEQRGLSGVGVTVHEMTLEMTPEVAWLLVTGSGFVSALSGLDPAQIDAVRDGYLGSLARDGVRSLDVTTLIGVGTRA